MLSITPFMGTKNATVGAVARGRIMVAKGPGGPGRGGGRCPRRSDAALGEAAGGARGGAMPPWARPRAGPAAERCRLGRGRGRCPRRSDAALGEAAGGARGGALLFRGAPLAALREPPLADAGVVAGQEHVRHGVPAPLGRARVVRVLGGA